MGAVIYLFIFNLFSAGGDEERWGSIIRPTFPYLHYSYEALCNEDTFLEDVWAPCVIGVTHVSPSDKAGRCLLGVVVHSMMLEVWLLHICGGESKTPAESF